MTMKPIFISHEELSAEDLLKRVLHNKNKKGIIKKIALTDSVIFDCNKMIKKYKKPLFDIVNGYLLSHRMNETYICNNYFYGGKINSKIPIIGTGIVLIVK